MPILSFSDLQIRCAEENKSIYEVAQEEEASLLGEVVDVVRLKVLEDFNRDNYIITWTGLFGMKHEECIYDRNVDKYKNNKKYNIFKF